MPETAEEFRSRAASWLDSVTTRRDTSLPLGAGDDSVAVFENLTEQAERDNTDAGRRWERLKFDAGWGALSWPLAYGGQGLPKYYELIFREEESLFDVPRRGELFSVTQQLIAPTIRVWGTPDQQSRFIRPLLRTDLMACQLFSEPEAGSDLAAVRTRAARDKDGWLITGQKTWTSGARVADLGEAICRTDPDVDKHAGLSVFLIPLDAPGVTVRPIRQMTGGASFNEVFLDCVRIGDDMRLGPVGQGWRVARTTLAAERLDSGSLGAETIDRLLPLAANLGRGLSDIEADRIVDVYVRSMIARMTGLRIRAAIAAGAEPGPEASVGKLYATETMRRTSDVALQLLGPAMIADGGRWGTFAWAEHLLGAPGYRIAGGTDEIQRTIIAERVLGMPREPAG
jgi:alkylation response protein AidB-like acyl-CoA dehydrogenase